MADETTNGILAALNGLFQGAASGSIDRATFDQQLKETAAKARLMEAQIAGQQAETRSKTVSPEVAKVVNPNVLAQTPEELKGLQGEKDRAMKKTLQEMKSTTAREVAQLREKAHSDAATAKSMTDLQAKIDTEVNRREDNARSRIAVRLGGMIPQGSDSERELNDELSHLRADVEYEYKAAWAMQHQKVGMLDRPTPNPVKPTTAENTALDHYLKDISTMTAETMKSVNVPTNYRNNPQVKEAFAKRIAELGLK